MNKAKGVKEEKLLSIGLAAFLHRTFSKYDPDLADQFLDAIIKGAMLADGDPFLAFRQKLIWNATAKKYSVRGIVGLAIKAWNAKAEGKVVKDLKLNPREEPRLEFRSMEESKPQPTQEEEKAS